MNLTLVIPGPLDTPTGGFIYDRRLIEELQSLGYTVDVLVVENALPLTGPTGTAELKQALEAVETGHIALVDGLAGGSHPEALQHHAQRLKLVSLVHHPLAHETGLTEQQQRLLTIAERTSLSHARAVLCTSQYTASILHNEFGIPVERLGVAAPGVDKTTAIPSLRPERSSYELLCVATITRRKGHDVLLQALSHVQTYPWHLQCIGSTDRDPQTMQAVLSQREALGLTERVTFHGKVDDERLRAAYQHADLFVLASYYEGYGMVLAEALAWGCPVISTRGGAIVDTVPPKAGRLVEPGDPVALATALQCFFDDPSLRADLRLGAMQAGQAPRTWTTVATEVDTHLKRWFS